ncbi:hypothetical protein [Halorhabdus rudnickae]|uniref:hypothetical protein n=1 Tax=Halorhabdus rudnickae TaxID=1775544 RepID=UPI0010838498|nr:hypothetical protein [Halorhabdus rudnickae]
MKQTAAFESEEEATMWIRETVIPEHANEIKKHGPHEVATHLDYSHIDRYSLAKHLTDPVETNHVPGPIERLEREVQLRVARTIADCIAAGDVDAAIQVDDLPPAYRPDSNEVTAHA